ncbi:hypothetical protein [Thermodesulfatator atlanticus]
MIRLFYYIILLFLFFGLLSDSFAESLSVPLPMHDNLKCSDCHLMDRYGKAKKDLRKDFDINSYCMNCHAGVMTHPVGVKLASKSVVFILRGLPLGKGDTVTCLTCHNIHQKEIEPYLLRKPPQELLDEMDFELNIYSSLCIACHNANFFSYNPHTESAKNCIYCHIAFVKNKIRKDKRLKSFLDQYSCTPCHAEVKCVKQHGYNPFEDPKIRKKALAEGIDVSSGRGCILCHQHHLQSKDAKNLKDYYLPFAWESRSVNPHWKELFCLCCHKSDPSPEKAPLKDNDFNKLCERCHDNKFARADIHPVGIKPKKVKVPHYMPLQNGELTCETCHNSLLQCFLSKHAQKYNRNFLRREGLPRYKFCFLCHEAKAYQRLNPHVGQIDEKGNIVEEKCLLCHSSLPDVKHVKGISSVKFMRADPDECCKGCHPGYEKYHPAGYTHVGVKPKGKLLKAIKESPDRIGIAMPLYNGKIICASCHNPHDPRLSRYWAPGSMLFSPHKLRLPSTLQTCVACHVDKSFKPGEGKRYR